LRSPYGAAVALRGRRKAGKGRRKAGKGRRKAVPLPRIIEKILGAGVKVSDYRPAMRSAARKASATASPGVEAWMIPVSSVP